MFTSYSFYKQFAHLHIPHEEIVSATNNFSDANLIAESAFRKAYKGQLSRSEQHIDIVVDKLHDYRVTNEMFWKEISRLSRLKHENVVPIFGFCDEEAEKIIIYKLKAQGSLETFLRDPAFTWERRLEISVGVAKALLYVNDDCNMIHLNISSTNILLDDNWKPKLSGFHDSKDVPRDRRYRPFHVDVPGSQGYIDPYYEVTGMISLDSDMYAFGVVLFEVLCGRRAYVPAYHLAKESSKVDVAGKVDQITEQRSTDVVGKLDEGQETTNSSTAQRPDDELLAPLAKFYYEAKKLDDMVDPDLWEEMDPNSFMIFSEQAYLCLKPHPPTIRETYHTLKEALNMQRKHENLTKNLELVEIGLKDIKSATENFSPSNEIGSGGFGTVYKAILKLYDNKNSMAVEEGEGIFDLPKTHSTVAIKCIKDKEGEEGFSTEIKMLGRCRHRNIVSLLGFCDEGSLKILVYEYVSRGSLDWYLERVDEMKKFKWIQRLQMCLDIAQGLKYLHTKKKIIHRDIKSANILLDDDWMAKIADFGLSKMDPMNQEVSYLDTRVAGTSVYLDPEYENTNKLREASDIFSLGVVLFEIMSGTLAYDMRYTKKNLKGLAPFVRQEYLHKGTVKDMLDSNLKEEIDENIFTPGKGPNQDSVDRFFDIAYNCLAETAAQRPNIKTIVDKLKEAIHYQNNSKSKHRISLGAITLATNNFNKKNHIGTGGFGRFYRGNTTNANGSHNHIVVQRLDTFVGGGETQFLTELKILTNYEHENVIGLLGYCDESDEKIIVYEYASRGSLDRHLKDTDLTWKQRLQICIDVASGLQFLQGGGLMSEFVILGNIKCSKILLNQDWKAKLCFGLSSTLTEKNKGFVIDKARGKIKNRKRKYGGDPSYEMFGLTKESDIFSFGYLLCEIFTGMLFSEFDDDLYNSFAEAAFKGIKEEIAPKSLIIFGSLINDCLNDELQNRPTIGEVLQRLKQASEFQVDYERWNPKLPNDFEQIIKMSNSPTVYSTEKDKDLYDTLIKGILLQEGKVLFTLGNNGERNLMVSAQMFSYHALHRWRSVPESRFLVTSEMLDIFNLKIEIKTITQLLSPDVYYGVYLVFKFSGPKIISRKSLYVNLKYQDGSKTSHAYFATWRDSEWMMIELVRFLNDNEDKDFEFILESFSQCNLGDGTIYIEGIEFRPITHEPGELKKVQEVLKLDTNMDLLQKLPTNYREILKRIENDDGGEELYWLREVNGVKHLMLSTKAALSNSCDVKLFKTTPSYQSRFPEVIELLPQQVFRLNCAIKSLMLSRDIDYACYLVFKLSEQCHGLHYPVRVRELLHSTDKETEIIYFRPPSPWNIHDIDQTPEERADGWMEVKVWKFNINHEFEDDYLHVNFRLISFEETISGLIVCGLDFRPM